MPDPRIFDLHNSWSVNGRILWTGWQFSKLWNMIENAREFDRNIGRKTPLLILTATSNWILLYPLVKSFSRRRKLPFGCPSKISLASSRVIWPQKYEQSLYKKFKNSPLFLKFPCIFWFFFEILKMFERCSIVWFDGKFLVFSNNILISIFYIISDREAGHKITEIKRRFIHNKNHSTSSVRHLVFKSTISYPERIIQFFVQKRGQAIKCHRHCFSNSASFRPRTKIDVYAFEQSNFNMYDRISG